MCYKWQPGNEASALLYGPLDRLSCISDGPNRRRLLPRSRLDQFGNNVTYCVCDVFILDAFPALCFERATLTLVHVTIDRLLGILPDFWTNPLACTHACTQLRTERRACAQTGSLRLRLFILGCWNKPHNGGECAPPSYAGTGRYRSFSCVVETVIRSRFVHVAAVPAGCARAL